MANRGGAPVLLRRAEPARRYAPLILLLHGHGVDERDIFPLEALFPRDAGVAALRGPIASEGGYRWYAHESVGRPLAASLRAGIEYVQEWLTENARDAGAVWVAGFSGGAVMAGALALDAPQRFAGVALLHGTLPFDAELPLEPHRLERCEVFYGYGESDDVIPPALVARSCAYLREQSGANAVVRGYRAAHGIPPAEERDLARWYASLT
jgi:phospholipase/carboxylesterase